MLISTISRQMFCISEIFLDAADEDFHRLLAYVYDFVYHRSHMNSP
jgi:hypothetical protein